MNQVQYHKSNDWTAIDSHDGKLVVPKGVKKVDFRNNNLTQLTLPEGVVRKSSKLNLQITKRFNYVTFKFFVIFWII